MRQSIGFAIVLVLAALAAPIALAFAIPDAEMDEQRVFWGTASNFAKPGEVQYEEVIKNTDEFRQMKKEKVARGTGRYWILMSQASDKAVKAIAVVGEETEYDLIAQQGYLASLKEPIPAEDVTGLVIEAMKGSLKAQKATDDVAAKNK
jgi:hypothetical protein